MKFVYEQLRDSILQPAQVDRTDNAFVLRYAKKFKSYTTKNELGMSRCPELESVLDSMCSRMILQRKRIKLNPWMHRTGQTWSYALTEYADTIMEELQQYFLNFSEKEKRSKDKDHV